MEIFNFIKGMFDSSTLGDNIIGKQVEIYEKQESLFPGRDPHTYLAQVWLSRMTAHGNNANDPDLQTLAFTETYSCACVPPPYCARALGLFILYKERPDIIKAYPKFAEEYSKHISPVMESLQNGSIGELYKKYNPQIAAQGEGA